MPLSEKYRVLFVHIPKAGGTSLEKLLDIPVTPHALLVHNLERLPALQHYTPMQLLPLLTDEQRHQYLKIVLIRNPYARAVSDYCWFQQRHAHVLRSKGINTFLQFVRWRKEVVDRQGYSEHPLLSHFRPMRDYFQDAAFCYDLVLRLEQLSSTGIDELRRLLPTLANGEIPHENKSGEHDNDYQTFYCDESRRLIEEIEKPSTFGYEF